MCVAIPGRVVAVHDHDGTPMATVEWGERRLDLSLALVPEAEVGDWILGHSGLAVRRMTDEEALETQELFRDSGRNGS